MTNTAFIRQENFDNMGKGKRNRESRVMEFTTSFGPYTRHHYFTDNIKISDGYTAPTAEAQHFMEKLFNEIYHSKVAELLKANDPTVSQAKEILTLNDEDFTELKRHYPKGWAVNSHAIMGVSDLHRYIGDCGVANITRFIGVITFKTAGNCFANPIRLPIGDTIIERQSHSVLVVNEWIVDPALNANTMNFDDYIKLLWKENDKLRIDFILSRFMSWDDSIHALNTRQCELFKNHDFGCSEQKFLAAATTADDGQAHLKECIQMLQGVCPDYVKAHQAMNDLLSGKYDY